MHTVAKPPANEKAKAPCACGQCCLECRGGRSLDPEVASDFGHRFGHDFADVRIYTDDEAAEEAKSMRARAFTIGSDIVFGEGAWAPSTQAGRRLLAHELVHVVQNERAPSFARTPLDVSHSMDAAEQEADRVADAVMMPDGVAPPIAETPRAVSRMPLDVSQIDRTINNAAVVPPSLNPVDWILSIGPQLLGHQQGEIAFAANYPGSTPPTTQPASPVPAADTAPVPIDSGLPVNAHFFPSGRLQSKERALILGGFHGDEHPGWQIIEALITELSTPPTGARPLFFHTMVVPRVNPGGIADELGGVRFWRNRCNRQVVDLNRNFPPRGTKSTPCPNTEKAPEQPEVEGVIKLIRAFKPDRILSTHAITNPREAGVFADLNTDPAAIALAQGMARTIGDPDNRLANKLTATSFNPIYPKDKPGPPGAGSLGAFGPTASGGNIPVITIEAPKFSALTATGPRSTEAFLRPTRAFLADPAVLDAQPDEDIIKDIDSMAAADRVKFLTGRLPLADKIYERIRLRVDTAVANLNKLGPPTPVKVVSGLRLYSQKVPGATGGSPQAELVYNKFFLKGSYDSSSFPTSYFVDGDRSKGVDKTKWRGEKAAKRLEIILQFSALPGASRHHWATDVDFNSTSSAEWAPAPSSTAKPGPLFDLGVWLQANAARAGFAQAYTPGRTSGYLEEAWHYSYMPLAVPLRQRYNSQVNLSTDVADAFLNDIKTRASNDGLTPPTDLDAAVQALKISDLVNSIGPGL